MVKGTTYFLVAMMGLLLTGCEEEPCGCVEEQPVYFEYRYVNHAWGYQERGWLIDALGHVRRFILPEGFRLPDSTGLLSRTDLLHNLTLTDSVINSVSQSDLEYYTGLISGAADGPIGESRNIAADAGSSELSCYLYDSTSNAYRQIFLAQSGDWEQFNTSTEAGILVDWLLDFGVFWLSE